MRPKRNCCGNARRHRCRSLLKAARGPWKCRARGKRGKPKAGFPLFPPALENLAKTARFSHFHRPGVGRLGKWKTSPRFSTFPPGPRDDDDEFLLFKPKPKKGSRPLRGLLVLFTPLSLRSSGRAEPRFHAHPSMLILRLENAVRLTYNRLVAFPCVGRGSESERLTIAFTPALLVSSGLSSAMSRAITSLSDDTFK